MTKAGSTHIGFIMDRSGSMGAMAIEASNAFNTFIEDQQQVEGEATLTLVQFDNKYEVVHDFIDINDVPTYQLVPRGATALLDAIGITINTIGERLAALPEEERPEKVLIAIMTDGYENASQEFTGDKIRSMIERQENEYSWTFMYLGANQDSFAVAQSFGVSVGNTKNFVNAADGMSSINLATTSYRSASYDMGNRGSLLADQDENQ